MAVTVTLCQRYVIKFVMYINAGCAVVGTVIISCLFVYHIYSSKGATNVLQMPLVEPSPKNVYNYSKF